jgi:tRNA dimethylallyltransferase
MQVYEGLDILTNKIPIAERQGIDHLLMGFKKPGEQYVVTEWVEDATRLVRLWRYVLPKKLRGLQINETHVNEQIPIVVGGTSYWIQHLLFPDRLSNTSDSRDSSQPEASMAPDLLSIVDQLPDDLKFLMENLPEDAPSANFDADTASSLHRLLSRLDPTMAERWHWKDTRKVLRSLQVIHESGRRASELVRAQSSRGSLLQPR